MNDPVVTEPIEPADRARQEEMPFAIVQGEPITELPRDLYIPPEALEIFLDAFEGPLDLLVYLIKRQNLNIIDIPVADITSQYMEYVELMKTMNLELAAEYLVMAAMLAEIKSRMLLPRPIEEHQEEDDPRAELIRRLQEYEIYKQAAEDLNDLPRLGRDVYRVQAGAPELDSPKVQPIVALQDVLFAFKDVMQRVDMFAHHHIQREPLSVRERMTIMLDRLRTEEFIEFTQLFTAAEGRAGAVVTLLAVLELIKEELIDMVQSQPFGPIHVKAIIS